MFVMRIYSDNYNLKIKFFQQLNFSNDSLNLCRIDKYKST